VERRAWVAARAEAFTQLCAAIGARAAAQMGSVSSLAVDEQDEPVSAARAALDRALGEKRALDLKRGITHAGPHRDDLELTLGGRDLRLYGSAGQQRTAAIALRMLEAATLRDASGCEPLFLLDDPFAELDARRAHRILELLGDVGLGQTMLVVPRATDIPAELTRLERTTIRDGVLGA
jgi:DNA replication and repair protein RecF